MDTSTFDTMTRHLSRAGSRRGVLLGAVAGLLPRAAPPATAKKTKKITICLGGQTRKVPRKAKARYLAQGATLGACLTCPQGMRPCRGSCLSTLICCVDQDCAGGRTCQDGTCACPASKPHLCAGSTICQQCCQSADCWPDGQDQGDGEICQDGVCTCSQPGTRRCTSGIHTGECGRCCLDSECPGAETCAQAGPGPASCLCWFGAVDCLGYCVEEACEPVCNQSCNNPGAVCCGSRGTLICQPQQGGGAKCQP